MVVGYRQSSGEQSTTIAPSFGTKEGTIYLEFILGPTKINLGNIKIEGANFNGANFRTANIEERNNFFKDHSSLLREGAKIYTDENNVFALVKIEGIHYKKPGEEYGKTNIGGWLLFCRDYKTNEFKMVVIIEGVGYAHIKIGNVDAKGNVSIGKKTLPFGQEPTQQPLDGNLDGTKYQLPYYNMFPLFQSEK